MRSLIGNNLNKTNQDKIIDIEFNEKDITNALFYNKPPQVEAYPFKNYKNPKFQKLSLTYEISIQNRNQTLDKALSNVIKIDNVDEVLLKLQPWMLLEISKNYRYHEGQWSSYFFENIKKYCEDNVESRYNWKLIEHVSPEVVFNLSVSKMTVEQRFWIVINKQAEEIENKKFIMELRESILPWLNIELYDKIKKKEENTRINVNYEADRQRMYDGTFINEDELDVVK